MPEPRPKAAFITALGRAGQAPRKGEANGACGELWRGNLVSDKVCYVNFKMGPSPTLA